MAREISSPTPTIHTSWATTAVTFTLTMTRPGPETPQQPREVEVMRFHLFNFPKRKSTSFPFAEINFLSVAMHELGHALGLGHSSDAHNSIMFPYYKAGRTLDGQQLGYDDVMGMYNLYSESIQERVSCMNMM